LTQARSADPIVGFRLRVLGVGEIDGSELDSSIRLSRQRMDAAVTAAHRHRATARGVVHDVYATY